MPILHFRPNACSTRLLLSYIFSSPHFLFIKSEIHLIALFFFSTARVFLEIFICSLLNGNNQDFPRLLFDVYFMAWLDTFRMKRFRRFYQNIVKKENVYSVGIKSFSGSLPCW